MSNGGCPLLQIGERASDLIWAITSVLPPPPLYVPFKRAARIRCLPVPLFGIWRKSDNLWKGGLDVDTRSNVQHRPLLAICLDCVSPKTPRPLIVGIEKRQYMQKTDTRYRKNWKWRRKMKGNTLKSGQTKNRYDIPLYCGNNERWNGRNPSHTPL